MGARDDLTTRISNLFDEFEAVEVIEATEVVEAVEVIEAAKVLRPGKSLLMTAESSRHLNSALVFCSKKIFYSRIMKYHIEFLYLFCQRLLRPADVIFLKTKGPGAKNDTSESPGCFNQILTFESRKWSPVATF